MKAKKLFLTMLGIIFIIGFPHAILGQLSVIATIPADGAINVDPAVTFQITFNAPLDTSVRFDYPQNFFLSLAIEPDTLVGAPDSITLSPDLKTVYVHNLHLWSDTKYLLFIANAVSATHDSLSLPYLVTFTTGSILPTATVSGKVSYPGIDVTGTAVILFNNPLFGEEEVEAENAAIVQTSAGNYAIKYVSPGCYWPVAVQDYSINADGGLVPNVGGSMGFYDPDGNGVPDSIVISEGQQVTGIDISLFSLAPVTARHNYPTVEDSAQSWASDAALVQLGSSDISPAGEAMIWMYAFYSPILAAYRAWVTTDTLVMPMEMEEPPEDTTALPTNWLDSDVVADSAEAHGGSDFRANHPDAFVMALLATIDLEEWPMAKAFNASAEKISKSFLFAQRNAKACSKTLQIQGRKPSYSLQKYQSIQARRAVWLFIYFTEAEGPEFSLMFDAVTGEYIQLPQPAETTARFNLAAANQSAQTWASDAALVWVQTHQSNLSTAGKAEMWFYAYYSVSLDSGQAFFFSNGMLLAQMGGETPFKAALPFQWIDSDVAIDTAEAHGGSQYRASNQNVMVSAGVSRGLLPDQPERAVWYFDYNSSAAGQLTIYVDAVTGGIITGMDSRPQEAGIPQSYALNQNFPNPFNPETVIEYQLPNASDVEISIFNLQGQKVATLVRDHRTGGYHKTIWNGRDEFGQPVASGVYLYQLEAGKFVAVKKMLLLR